jgi:hypothetical protein
MDTAARLEHLLAHWVEHNDAHKQTYREWAEKASEEGLIDAAQQLGEAVRAVETANGHLRAAAQALDVAGDGHKHKK